MPKPGNTITSRANPLVKTFREAQSGKQEGFFLLEGVRFLEESLKVKFPLDTVLYLESSLAKPRAQDLLRSLQGAGVSCFPATEEVLAAASEVESPQGFVALARRPEFSMDRVFSVEKAPFLLVAAGISDPGNLGSMIRTADAAGAAGVIVCEGSASPFNPKAVRSSMGSIVRLPVAEKVSAADLVRECQERKLRLVATDSHSGIEFRDADYSGPIALCLGAEAEGIPEEIRKAASLVVRIRLRHDVESLNVAAAGAILLFEIAERRGV